MQENNIIVPSSEFGGTNSLGKNRKISFWGCFTDYSGYSYANRNFLKGLLGSGWDVKIAMLPTKIDVPINDMNFLNSISVKENKPRFSIGAIDPRKPIRLISQTPTDRVPKDMHNVIYTMIETVRPSELFVRTCNNNYEMCLTPTEYYKKVFIESGMKMPVYVVPIGIDEKYINHQISNKFFPKFSKFNNYGSIEEWNKKIDGYKFLSVFRWNFRKSPEILIRAFLEEFTTTDNVSLVLFSKNMDHRKSFMFHSYITNHIKSIINKYSRYNSAPIYLSEESVSMENMPDMYAIGDCFLLPSRGEGLCLPALEASAMGLPIIVTNHTAFTDYCREDNSYALEVDELVKYENKPEWYQDDVFIKEYAGECFPILGEEFIKRLRTIMRHVMKNTDEAKKKNENMKKVIEQKYTWSKCISKMNEVLLSIKEEIR